MTEKIHLKSILDSALSAVAPDLAVRNTLNLEGSVLTCEGVTYDLDSYEKVYMVGAGKGAAPMAAEMESLLGDRLAGGIVCVKYDHGQTLHSCRILEAAHPVPDVAGEEAAQAIMDTADLAGENDLIICVITGGASALTPLCAAPVTLDDVRATTQLLMEAGASIQELNCVRKHLSAFSGGQLARAAFPATTLTLIVSDVVGDDLDVIASGPATPDPTTFADAMGVLERHGLTDKIPTTVRKRIAAGASGDIPDTPKAGDPIFDNVQNVIVAGNTMALNAARDTATSLGYDTRILTTNMVGEARDEAAYLVHQAQQAAAAPHDKPICLLAGGETVVTVKGTGKGGRNQEMALAFSIEADNDDRFCGLFAGTDGTDGPTDAAGGYALPDSLARAATSSLDPQAYLDNNDAYHFLKQTGDLLITGPTRTNVMDISIILVQ